jgi:hypothetical protein
MQWFELLNHKVEQLGRRQVEADTGMSKTTLSLVLNQKYLGSMDNIKTQVVTAYTNISVTCPVLGTITVKRCNDERIKPFSASNPIRVRLYQACKNCPNNTKRLTNE